jgi:hypothetical protein
MSAWYLFGLLRFDFAHAVGSKLAASSVPDGLWGKLIRQR